MSAQHPLAFPETCRQSFQLDQTFWISFQIKNGAMDAVWSPTPPGVEKLQELLPAYRAARNNFLRKLGLPILVVEL